MKNHRFLWLRNRTTDNRKCEKARNIKEKRTIEMFNTVLKQLVELLSSQKDNHYTIYQLRSTTSELLFATNFVGRILFARHNQILCLYIFNLA